MAAISEEKTPTNFMNPVQNGGLLNFSEFTVPADGTSGGVDVMRLMSWPYRLTTAKQEDKSCKKFVLLDQENNLLADSLSWFGRCEPVRPRH